MESDTTTHLRPSILTSFLSRGSRPRSTATSPTGAESPGINSNNASAPINVGIGNVNNRRRGQGGVPGSGSAAAANANASAAGQNLIGQSHTPPTSLPIMPAPTATSFSQMLRRRRSNNGNLNQAAAASPANPPPAASPIPHPAASSGPSNNAPIATGPAHRIRLVPHLENSRALHFEPITRECRENAPAIRIGRFTDRSGTLAASTNSLTGKIAFKSKVVSRGHAELWCEVGGKFMVKDTSSSSGTFLNHIRLSSAGVESRPHILKDGDILQLGVDYQGGTEEIYRCVKIRVEIGREWQAGPNPFNTNAMAQLKALSNLPTSSSAPAASNPMTRTKSKKTTASDCCICLFPVTVCQALFIAPCSHSFHYKCIRGTLLDHHPGFSCPLCRSFHNLEADVEVDIQEEDDEWEELPEPEVAALNAANGENDNAHDEEEHDPSAMMQDDLAAMDISDGNGGRRSMDDDDDIPLGFQTAAEHNDRRLLPQSLNQSHPNNLNQTLTPGQMVPNLPPPPAAAAPRRAPRRGTMVAGQTAPPAGDDLDHGFETDGGALGYGAETDMDVDEPRGHHGQLNGHARTGSGRGRAGMYNATNGGPNGSQLPQAYPGSAGMSSAPNLLRPGSALGQTLTATSSGPGNATPPGPPYHTHSPVNIRSPNTSQNPFHNHGMALSSSNPGASRVMMPGSLPGGSTSHLLGDAGGNGSGDRTMMGMDKPEEALSAEEHTVEGGASNPGAFGFGSKRKR